MVASRKRRTEEHKLLIAESGGKRIFSSIFQDFDLSIECLLDPWSGSDVSLNLLGRLFIEWRGPLLVLKL